MSNFQTMCNINQIFKYSAAYFFIEGKNINIHYEQEKEGEREIRNSSIQNPFLREKSNSRVSKAQKTS